MNNKEINGQIRSYYAFQFFRDFFLVGGVLIPFFTIWGGITLLQVQFLQSWFMFWHFILEVPTGVVADYFGRKKSVIIGLIFYFFGVLLYGTVPNFVVFLICEFILAMGVSLMSGADSAMLYDKLKEYGLEHESKKLFGKAQSWKLLGLMISAPIGSYIGAKMGLNYPMIFSSIFIIFAMFAIQKMQDTTHYLKQSEDKKYYDIFKSGISFIKQSSIVKKLSLNGILVASAGYFVIWLYQPLLLKIGVPISLLGYWHAFLVVVQIFISSNFVFIEKIFGFKRYLKISAILVAIGFFVAAITSNIAAAIVFLVLAGGFGLTRFELIYAQLNKYLPSENRSTILSAIKLFHTLFLVLINPLIGLIADQNLSFAFIFIALISLSSLLVKE